VQGKSIGGIKIVGYEQIPELNPEVILVASPEQHKDDIVGQLANYTKDINQIVVFNQSH